MTNILELYPEKKSIPENYFPEIIAQKEYLINGEIKIWNGNVRKVISPIYYKNNNELVQAEIGSFPLLTEKEALEALNAAENAFNKGRGIWPIMSVEKRIECFRNFVVKMKEQRSKVVNLLMWEIGKNLKDSEKEFDRTVEYIDATINSLKDLDRASSRFIIDQGIYAQIRRAPLGVVLCMGPFNYPLNETFTTLIPALIMGNTIVFKPAKYGTLLMYPLLEAFRDCFPKGVVNTVYGEGRVIASSLMATGKIDVLAFIGSAGAANSLEKQHPKPNRLRSVLGLGAKNPAIILPDADIELAVKECVTGSLSFNGQRCTALKIIFVHKDIRKQFNEAFCKAVSDLKIGMPWEEGSLITPLPETGKTDAMNEYVLDAVGKGAKIINEMGGGFFKSIFIPAVLFPVNKTMRLYEEEQFGPIVPIVEFDDINIPIRYIEDSNVGQQASIFGKDPDKIADLIDPFVNQVCRVNINCQCQRSPDSFPFTGRKDSAEGTLSVSDALRVFSIRTLVAAKESDINKEIFNKILKERKSNFLSTDFIL